jgi:hypothetical protein
MISGAIDYTLSFILYNHLVIIIYPVKVMVDPDIHVAYNIAPVTRHDMTCTVCTRSLHRYTKQVH